MEEQRKLELTLCDFANKGLKVKFNEEGLRELWDIDEDTSHLQDVYFIKSIDFELKLMQLTSVVDSRYTLDEVEFDWVVLLLHSLSKLTEPVLEGGLIPIVELAKISLKDWPWRLIDDRCIAKVDGLNYYFQYKSNVFECFAFGDGGSMIGMYIGNHLNLFEKIKEWHFNIYNLSPKSYIEKDNQLT